MNTCDLLLLVSNAKSYWWSLLPLTNLTNLSSLQNGKTQMTLRRKQQKINNTPVF